jgi:hypothetical protein
MPDKPSKFDQIIATGAAIVGIGGIVSIIAQILLWIAGGK